MSSVDAGTARRSFRRACVVGAFIATAVFTWMLAIGRADLFQSHVLDDFYDAQAHGLLAGHWDIPPDVLGFEAWTIGGKSYTYFGPWPAVLRLPVAALTDRLDGRLTQVSMLLAFGVLIVATTQLLWRVRELTGRRRAVTRGESWAIGGFVTVVGAGSTVLFLASRPVVYHEVQLWAIALAVAAFAAMLRFLSLPGVRPLAWAGVFAALSFLTRGSVGIGPIAAFALVLFGTLLAEVSGRFDQPRLRKPVDWLGLGGVPRNHRLIAALVLALAVPGALYMYVNYSKFGHPWNLPVSRHATAVTDELRHRLFVENGQGLFSLKYVPTDLVATFRPNALAFDTLFPWITFPQAVAPLGGITFLAIDSTTSIPVSMPLLTLLSAVGVVTVFRPRHPLGSRASVLRVPVIGAAIGAVGVVSIPFVYQRYIADFIPVLVLLSAAGLYQVLDGLEGLGRKRQAIRRTIVGVFVALAVASLWVNFALTILYQRAHGPYAPDEERAAFIRFQHDVDEVVPGGSRFTVRHGRELPEPPPVGTVFVVGDCAGTYWSDGSAWHAIERTQATGSFSLRLAFVDPQPGARAVLLTAGPPGRQDRLSFEHLARDRIRFIYRSASSGEELVSGAQPVRPGAPLHVEALYDARLGRVGVDVDGGVEWELITALRPEPPAVHTTRPFEKKSTKVQLLPATATFCSELRSNR